MIQAEEGGGGSYGGGGSHASVGAIVADPSSVVPPAASGGAAGGGDTQTVSQAYLAGLAAMGKNTSGDTAPYVVIPNQAQPSGGSINLTLVSVVLALGGAAWLAYKKWGGA